MAMSISERIRSVDQRAVFGILCAGLSLTAIGLRLSGAGSAALIGAAAGAAIMAGLVTAFMSMNKPAASTSEASVGSALLQGQGLILVTDQEGNHRQSTSGFAAVFGDATGLSGLREGVGELHTYADLERLRVDATGLGYAHAEIGLCVRDIGLRYWYIRVFSDGANHLVWMLDDITPEWRKRTEAQNQVRSGMDFLDNLPVGFFALDEDGRFEYANTRFASWVGRTPDQLVEGGILFNDLLSGDKTPPQEGVGYITLNGPGTETFRAYVIRNRRQTDPAGGTRAVALRDPGNGEDSEEQENEAANALPDWLFGEAPVGIAILDDHGTIENCNAALGRFLDRPPDQLRGVPFMSFVAAEDQGDCSSVLSKLMMGTATAAHMEARFPSDGGAAERAASLFVSRIDDDGGMVLHVIDETEHRHLELQFTQSQKMQAVGQLAGGVAHDFNNLLTAMIGFSDLLLERHGPDDASFTDIMQIRQNANRATNLVRQLLAFSRKQALKPAVLDPIEMLGDLSHLLGRLIGERVELKFEHAPDTYLVRADRGQFDQVIINLAVNARDAMPGGGTLTVRTHNETVTAPVQRGPDVMPPGAYVVISVSDTGTGISRENIDRIFESFFSTKEAGAGTGLGLSTVYGIIRQSGGFIYVESAMGHGATFHIYLSASGSEGEKGVQAAVRAADKARIRHRSARENDAGQGQGAGDLTGNGVVLLVEDEDAVRLFGARALRNKGYTVLEADNGETALDALNGAEMPVDLIVSDVVMPGMDGHTFVQLVRQEMPDMRVVLMSGYTEEVFREETSRDPSIHFLAKPFSLKTLASTVRDVMSG